MGEQLFLDNGTLTTLCSIFLFTMEYIMALFVENTNSLQPNLANVFRIKSSENVRRRIPVLHEACSLTFIDNSRMCIRVVVGKYNCGHQRSLSHGIPDEFIRQCEDSLRFIGCTIDTNEEDVPWLCPNCHWEYVKQNLAPIWQQITITKCRVLQDVQIYPTESSYVNAQKAADRLNSTFKNQQDGINVSAVSYHKLRDSTLRCFLAENFDVCMGHAHYAHRPWSWSYQQEPFARTRADIDLDSSSPGPVHDLIDLRSPPEPAVETEHGVISPDPSTVQSVYELTHQDVPPVEPHQDPILPDQSNLEINQGDTHPDMQPETPLPGSPAAQSLDQAISDVEISDEDMSDYESGELRCLSCDNRGVSYGVSVNRRICLECEQERGGFTGFDQDRYNDLIYRIRTEMEALPSRQSEHQNHRPFGTVTEPTPLSLEVTFRRSDLSSLPTLAPTTITPSLHGTLSPFLARQQENEYANDATRDLYRTLAHSLAARSAVEDLHNGPFGRRLAGFLSSQSRRESRTPPGPPFAERHMILRNARRDFHIATANYSAAITRLVARQDPGPASGPTSAVLLHASDMSIEGDEQGDGTTLGRFFANADNAESEDAEYAGNVSDNVPDEPPRQRRRLN